VRIPPDDFDRVAEYVRELVSESLHRLRVPRVALLQLHNGITAGRGDEPASIAPGDILGRGGIRDALRQLQEEELVQHIGLTGTGHTAAMCEVIRSGEFDALQVPYNLLNPSAGTSAPVTNSETDYGNVIADCSAARMGVFAIRVFAGGALLDQPPSAHTLKTPYFPLALYQRDAVRVRLLGEIVGGRMTPAELAARFAIAHPNVSSAIIGFGSPEHVGEVARIPFDEPLPADLAALLAN
jgi:aryl-alcohol dehydrogenase-like predicted oxidoreductase